MATSDFAIGFHLQLQNHLSPALKTAEKDYARFTKSLDAFNSKAFKSASMGMKQVGDLMKSIKSMPTTLSESYQKAISKIERKIKPIRQPVELQFTATARKNLTREITAAVSEALGKVQFRLRPTTGAKSSLFDTTADPKSEYRKYVQPPDYVGKLKIPKFAKGGIVDGPELPNMRGREDSVAAMLSKGEEVLSKNQRAAGLRLLRYYVDLTSGVRTDEGRRAKLTTVVGKSALSGYGGLLSELHHAEGLKPLIESGFGKPEEIEQYNKLLDDIKKRSDALERSMSRMGLSARKILAPALQDVRDKLHEMKEPLMDESTAFEKLLKSILGNTRFLVFAKSWQIISEQFREFRHSASEVFGGEKMDDFVKSMNRVNRTLNVSRSELHHLKMEATAFASSTMNVDEIGESIDAVVKAGVRGSEEILHLGVLSGQLAKATGVDVDDIAESVHHLTLNMRMEQKEISDMFMGMKAISRDTNTSIASLNRGLKDSAEAAGGFLAALGDPHLAKRALDQLGEIQGALAELFGNERDAEAVRKQISEALGGNIEAQQSLRRSGLDFDQLRTALANGGDIKAAMSGFGTSTAITGVAGETMQERVLNARQAVGLPVSAAGFQRLAQNHGELGALLSKEHEKASLEGSLKNITSWGAQATASMAAFGAKLLGPAADALREFNPLTIIAALQMANFGITLLQTAGRIGLVQKALYLIAAPLRGVGILLAGGIGKIFGKSMGETGGFLGRLHGKLFKDFKGGGGGEGGAGLGGMKGFTDGARTILGGFKDFIVGFADTIAKVLSTLARGIGATFASIGKGVGSALASIGQGLGGFIAGVGQGAGTAIAAIFGGLATGLTLMAPAVALFAAPPVILGLAVLTGAFAIGVVALGAALNLAAPGIAAFGTVIGAAFEGISNMLSVFMGLDMEHMILLGPALLGISVGLGALTAVSIGGGFLDSLASLFGGGTGRAKGLIKDFADLAVHAPAINTVADAIHRLATSLSEFGAAIGGLTQYSPATISSHLSIPVSAKEISEVTRESQGGFSQLHADIMTTNELLTRMLEVLTSRLGASPLPAGSPVSPSMRVTPRDDGLRDFINFQK